MGGFGGLFRAFPRHWGPPLASPGAKSGIAEAFFSTFCAFLTVFPREMIVFRPFSRHFAGFQFSCAARSAAREARRPLCRGKKPAAGGGLKSRCFGFFGAPKSDLGGPARNLLESFNIPFLLLLLSFVILIYRLGISGVFVENQGNPENHGDRQQ